MQLLIAEKAGFCFGVKNAVEKAYSLANSSKNVYTLGPIIHNNIVVKELNDSGVKVIEDINDLSENDMVIIRSHGVAKEIYKMLENKGIEVEDATCPNVKSIHNIVESRHKEGYKIVIIGDENHPEVKGINGWCENDAIIVNSKEDILKRFDKQYEKLCVVSQTTFSVDKWYEMIQDILKFSRQVLIYNTICSATELRQKEADELSEKVDAMVVIGSRESSNTQKLYDVCSKKCKNVIFAEDANDINVNQLKDAEKVGLTTGASTPQKVIDEVINKLNGKEDDDKVNNETEKNENVTSKEDMNQEYESMQDFMKGFKDVHEGAEVKGKVIQVNDHEVYFDIGYKSDAVLPSEEMSDPEANMKELFKVDDVLDVKVVKMNNGEGNVVVSRKYIDFEETLNKINDAKDKKEIIEVNVKGVNKGGFECSYKGLNVFMPFSLSGLKKDEDHNILMGKTVRSIITDVNKKRNNIELVVTRKEVLKEERDQKMKAFFDIVKEGDEGSGIIKTIIPQGCFINNDSVDVFIPASEISYKRGLKPEELLHVGDTAKYIIIRVDGEKKRVTGSIKRLQKDPWEVFASKYKEEDVIEGRVVSMTDFGAFVEIVDGVDGLVHISQISEKRINKPKDVLKINQIVKAKILKVDIENKKISLSIKEVNNTVSE